MLDNLREDAEAAPYFEDDEIPDFLDDVEKPQKPKSDPFAFLGPVAKMTAVQRFIISAMLFMMVCLIGSMFLLVTGKFFVF